MYSAPVYSAPVYSAPYAYGYYPPVYPAATVVYSSGGYYGHRHNYRHNNHYSHYNNYR